MILRMTEVEMPADKNIQGSEMTIDTVVRGKSIILRNLDLLQKQFDIGDAKERLDALQIGETLTVIRPNLSPNEHPEYHVAVNFTIEVSQ